MHDYTSVLIRIIYVYYSADSFFVNSGRTALAETARLLADLMATQAKKPSLNYSLIDQTENKQGFEKYILAIHAGVSGNYEPIKSIFKALLEQSIPISR